MNAPDHRPESRLDQQLGQRARQLYQRAAQNIDPDTADLLRAARRKALQSAEAPQPRVSRWLIPTGAFAVLALAALMMWQPVPQHHATAPMQASGTSAAADLESDLPPDADQTDPNLYQNLDFYGWLAASNAGPAAR
ncbi:MAG: hypothetical protein M3Y93_11400 [Pseudomonadota bacterium]|nr:hypothetical protein [Pseudomonadota bacterium]